MYRIIDDASPIPHRASFRRVVTPSYSSAAQSVDDDLQEARGAHTPLPCIQAREIADEQRDVAGTNVGANVAAGLCSVEERGECRGIDGVDEVAIDSRVNGHAVQPEGQRHERFMLGEQHGCGSGQLMNLVAIDLGEEVHTFGEMAVERALAHSGSSRQLPQAYAAVIGDGRPCRGDDPGGLFMASARPRGRSRDRSTRRCDPGPIPASLLFLGCAGIKSVAVLFDKAIGRFIPKRV